LVGCDFEVQAGGLVRVVEEPEAVGAHVVEGDEGDFAVGYVKMILLLSHRTQEGFGSYQPDSPRQIHPRAPREQTTRQKAYPCTAPSSAATSSCLPPAHGRG
jgi:hypothetical protein